MKEKFTINDFIDTIHLKNQLIFATKEEMLQEYQDQKEAYGIFLNAIHTLSRTDNGFLLLDENFIEKIEMIINANRFKIKGEDYTNLSNAIIIYLNGIKFYSEPLKDAIIEEYMTDQSDIRQLDFIDLNDFINILGKDAIIHQALLEKKTSQIDDIDFFGATNYFIAKIPELYQDEQIKKETLSKLEATAKELNPIHFMVNRRYQKTIHTLQSISNSK